MPLVRLSRSSSVVDAAFDAFEAKEWTGTGLTRFRSSDRTFYPKRHGFDNDFLMGIKYDEYAASIMSKDEYDEALKDVMEKLSSIYNTYTENKGYLTRTEARKMRDAHARFRALEKLGHERRFTAKQPGV